MHRGIIERLVCPEQHAMTPLVVRADRLVDSHLVTGAVGCPVCGREWPVHERIARFGDPAITTEPAWDAPRLSVGIAAALLNLAEPGVVLADGAPAPLAEALAADYGATVVAFDLADPVRDGRTSVIVGAATVPLAPAVARAALLLRGGRSEAFFNSAARTVVAGGRIVGGEDIPLPRGLQLLTRDAGLWVAERERGSADLVGLRRRES